ncbi:hypothetical protein CANARDRAFT_213279 [[Candida] arabinofermentans NRRL YB-2248]|uniref:HECT-type E3 ubiquitin transferase n=1 Tax=[Candida] arabinofermentans NRRL YB-2248 TaxID=983967 RepID=A0A1E4SZ67_9ASCO|nr:hypothetical protein CANARDRAFT_213279 [[Candida] arabinofermentans NRRL YB-2248]
MRIVKKDFVEKQELSKPVQDLVNQLATCPLPEFLQIIDEKAVEQWNGLRVYLFHYIPVLDRMDEILADHVVKYGLDQPYPLLQETSLEDEKIISSVLNYTYKLLEHCYNKEIYNSSHRVFELLLSYSMKVRLSALKLTCLICERFVPTQSEKFNPPSETKELLLKLSTFFPPQVAPMYSKSAMNETHRQLSLKQSSSLPQSQEDATTQQQHVKSKKSKKNKDKQQALIHVSLLDCITPDAHLPSKWKYLDFKYYNASADSKSHNKLQSLKASTEDSGHPNKRHKKHEILNTQSKEQNPHSDRSDVILNESKAEGLHHFILNEESVKKLSYQRICDKAIGIIPKENWFDFALEVHVAKAFNNKSPESIKLREDLVTMKCLAVAAASCSSTYSVMTSSVFDEEPYLLSYMSDLINPDNTVAFDPSYAALRAFISISGKRGSNSDLMRALGGNVNHGLLFHILRSVLKAAKEDKTDLNQSYLNYFFNLIANMLDSKYLAAHLRSAGLMNILLDFLVLRNSFRMTRSGPLQLIELFLKSLPEVLDDFIASNGFTILIDLLAYEVNFSFENPNFDGGAPKEALVSHTITVRQVKTINSLLKLVHHLIVHHQGDRMRNLYDSSILKSLIMIMENPATFGYELLTDTINIFSGIINSEPTAYAILNEAGVVDAFFKNLDGFLGKSADLLLVIPEATGAIALNKDGLKRVLDEDVISKFFTVFKDPALCKELLREENATALGFVFDELARHHPDLEPTIKSNILNVFRTTPSLVKFKPLDFHQSSAGSLYHSKTDPVIKMEDGESELEIWETSDQGDLLECTTMFLAALIENNTFWTKVVDLVTMDDCIKYIMIENVTFDYVLSNSLYSLTLIIKFFDVERPKFAFQGLLDAISQTLEELAPFISYDKDDSSYFDQFDENDAAAGIEGGKVLSKLGILNCLLYVFSDIYGSPNKLTSIRMQQLSSEFATDKGIKLMKQLIAFCRRITIEEVIVHSRTPSEVCKDVVAVNTDFSPYQVKIGKPNEKNGNWDGTSAKFKNLSVLCFHFTRCQSWLRYTFACLCRISVDRRQDNKYGMIPKNSVRIITEFSNTFVAALNNINTNNVEIGAGYTLLMVNQLYSALSMVGRGSDQLNSLMVICLLQNGGLIRLRELACYYFKVLKDLPTESIQEYQKLDYIDINISSTAVKLLSQILSVYTAVSTQSMVFQIPSQDKLYPDLTKNSTPYHRELNYSILVQTSLASYGLLNDLLGTRGQGLALLEGDVEKIPLGLIEKILAIGKNFYCSVSSSQSFAYGGRLYQLSYEQVAPSTPKIKYLESLGVNEASALEFLTFYKNSLDSLYSHDLGELEEQLEVESDINWEEVCQRADKNKFKSVEPQPVGPQYESDCTLDDLNFSRVTNEENFIDYWLTIAKLFPKSVYRVADLLNAVFWKSSYGDFMEYTEVVSSVFMGVCSFSFEEASKEGNEDCGKLSSLLHLLALLLDDRVIAKESELADNIFQFMIVEMKPEYANAGWFSNALLVFEKLLTAVKVPFAPAVEELNPQIVSPPIASFPDTYSVDPEIEESLFRCLLDIDRIDKVDSALAIARLLILFCDEDAAAARICNSRVIKPLVKSVQQFPDTETNLQAVIINSVRRCMESKKTIEAYISKEIQRIFTPKMKESRKSPNVRELMSLLKENSPLVMRSGTAFVESIVETCILTQCHKPLKSLMITSITAEQKKLIANPDSADTSMKDADEEQNEESTYSTGIMHLLLTELMTVGKTDFISSPDMTPEELEKEKSKTEKEKKQSKKQLHMYAKDVMFRNKNCAYTCFLLQTIAELLFSYKQAKTEFLTFSKKQGESFSISKPRSTSLNLLIHQFLSSDPFNTSESAELKRRRLVSLLASVCIIGLVSTTPLKGLPHNDPKIVDPDMTFVRKFTADILIRVTKEANSGPSGALERYSMIIDLLDLFSKMLGEKHELVVVISSTIEKSLTQNDPFLLSKELLDKKLSHLLASILADLDVNFPHTQEISNGVMKCLSMLGSIKVDKQELFKEGAHAGGDADEEDIDDDDLEEREETPDLLRNSTLGMYDVEDISDEEDEDSDDFLDGEDIEIVYSEDDGEDGDEDMVNDEDDMAILDQSDIELVEIDDGDDDDDGDDSESDDLEENDDSVDDLIADGELVLDLVSGSENSDSESGSEDSESYMDEDGYSDSDDMILNVNSSEEEDEEDEDDDNSDDDSAILEEWVAEHESDERRRRRHSHRHGRFALMGALNGSNDPSDADADEDEDDEEDLEAEFPGININTFSLHGSHNESNIIPLPVDNTHERNATNSSSLLNHLFFPRNGENAVFYPRHTDGNTIPQPLMMNRFTDILRALNGDSSHSSVKKNQQVPNIYIKSTLQRWSETATMFYGKAAAKEACRVIPPIVNNIFDRSKRIAEDEKRKAQEKAEKLKKAREEDKRKAEEEIEKAAVEAQAVSQVDVDNNNADTSEAAPREPIYVTIAGRPVDISGTDIDPEFLQALPEDMREEVFAQHIRERRAEATTSGTATAEVDSQFLAALPDNIRNEIMRDEYSNRRLMQRLHMGVQSDEDEEDNEIGESNDADQTQGAENDKQKKSSKIFFAPMADKAGVAALMKMVFVGQLYYKRESFFQTLGYLCYNKQTRGEIVSLLLYILQEGLADQASLESVYRQICQRSVAQESAAASKPGSAPKSPVKQTVGRSSTFPSGCTTLTVATQAIDIIQYLLENESHMRLHFLMDQDSIPLMKKLSKKNKLKDSGSRYPINVLLSLLDNKLIKEDTNLMDILSRTFQIATRPLQLIRARLNELNDDEQKLPKSPQLPIIPNRNLKQIINILVADECPSKVFQQTISSIQNLSLLENAKVVFPRELSKRATALSQHIAKDLRKVITEMKDHRGDEDDDIPSLAGFASSSSDQAKLLRVLTALDYLFQTKDNESQENVGLKELKELYKNSALGPLWGALSDCLRILRERSDLSHIATILSPLIEALMVVCKHSKVDDLPARDILSYEEKTLDFTNEPIESLFFSFTEEHKKILNQMIRSNPKLMSGPFSVLIRNPKVLEFDNKRIYFDQKLHEEDGDRTAMPVNIRRDQVFLDSFRALFFKSPDDIRKAKLDIQFRGEQGVDAGGLTREWYQVLSRQMFNPDYALFTPVASDKTTFHPNRTSWVNPEHLSFFKFVGIIIGKAVYDGCMLDCHFSRAVYKRLLGRPVSLKDIESLDLDYYKSLIWMLENDITDIISETFSVETDDYGVHTTIDLKENGSNIAVTEENKQEYVRLIVEYRLQTSVTDQMENFLQGFHQIIPKELIAVFDDQELELLISGLPDIDVDDWKNNSTYHSYTASSPQIQWFWRAVKSFDTEEKAKLLQFATGTSKVPLNGFKELTGTSGVSKFSIHRVYGATHKLPTSHTCFNQIDLPEYESYEKLRGSLLKALTEGYEGFGFA